MPQIPSGAIAHAASAIHISVLLTGLGCIGFHTAAPACVVQASEQHDPCILLMHAGVDPFILAAGELGPEFIEAFQAEAGLDGTVVNAYRTAVEDVEAKNASLSEIETQARSHGESQEILDAVNQARLDVESAKQAFHTACQDLIDSAVLVASDFQTEAVETRFARLIENRERSVPVEYKVLTLSEEQWALLEAASLLLEKDAAEDLLPEHQSLLNTGNADADVLAARQAVGAHLLSVSMALVEVFQPAAE